MALVFPVNRHANTKVIEVPPTILHRALGVMAISLSRGADKMDTQSVIALSSITIRCSGLWSARTSLRSLHKPFLSGEGCGRCRSLLLCKSVPGIRLIEFCLFFVIKLFIKLSRNRIAVSVFGLHRSLPHVIENKNSIILKNKIQKLKAIEIP